MSDTSKKRTRAEAEFAAVTKPVSKVGPSHVEAEDKTAKLKALRLAKEAADKAK